MEKIKGNRGLITSLASTLSRFSESICSQARKDTSRGWGEKIRIDVENGKLAHPNHPVCLPKIVPKLAKYLSGTNNELMIMPSVTRASHDRKLHIHFRSIKGSNSSLKSSTSPKLLLGNVKRLRVIDDFRTWLFSSRSVYFVDLESF
jgi:hypothetical protein